MFGNQFVLPAAAADVDIDQRTSAINFR